MGIVNTLLFTMNESQGGVWINTGVDVSNITTFMFQDVRNDSVYQEVVKQKNEIAVYTGGADVFTTIYRQNRDFNVRIYNNFLYASYNGTGPNTNVSKIYKQEILPDSYTVEFNANGGTGTMPPQIIPIDTQTALNINEFIKSGFSFRGWSMTPDGGVEFSDGEIVFNLTEIDETITLYAVWGLPQMEIIIKRNNSEKNKLDKDVTMIITLSGSLRNETSIIDPVIIISGNLEMLSNANYIEIPAFKRKYFITNIRTIRNGIIEVSAHVDVLSSFATEIRSNKAIVHKQENEWNLYLNDGTFKVYSDPIIETYLFPVSFPGTFSYVLAVAGGGSNANE